MPDDHRDIRLGVNTAPLLPDEPFHWITEEHREEMLRRICEPSIVSRIVRPDDRPFRNYTPFPKLDAVERRARYLCTEARERIGGAWKVLRHGDRDPFDRGGW